MDICCQPPEGGEGSGDEDGEDEDEDEGDRDGHGHGYGVEAHRGIVLEEDEEDFQENFKSILRIFGNFMSVSGYNLKTMRMLVLLNINCVVPLLPYLCPNLGKCQIGF
jgi:hypothetical protein